MGLNPAEIEKNTGTEFRTISVGAPELLSSFQRQIYVDGQVPFERVLTILDERLSSYEVAPQPQIPYQPPVSSEERVDYYEIGEGEVPDQKAQMVLGKLLCDYTDRKKVFALMVLEIT